jgi:oxygen-independent coproporphyrinogen-3 oxidase
MPVGIYVSVPFCRTKCTYCNFASDVFSRARFQQYIERVCGDISRSAEIAAEMGGRIERKVDSIYLGGGTPTVLEGAQLRLVFEAVRAQFDVASDAEVTVECAPGTLTTAMLDTLLACGVNRVSLGVQSFVDAESAAVGRLHKRETTLNDIARLRSAGITNLNIDLIAGLPHQTAESWKTSLAQVTETGAPHVSVYMLEVDDDSRLGRELIAGGTRYHAHFVPDDDQTAEFYLTACETLESTGIAQYEISNFACARFESRHNLKYWMRQPYLGFGVDAHSMLVTGAPGDVAVRFATSDALESFVADAPLQRTAVTPVAALEETFFLGLRLNRGVSLREVAAAFGQEAVDSLRPTIAQLISSGLLQQVGDLIFLTSRGRLLSNEVFQQFLAPASVALKA